MKRAMILLIGGTVLTGLAAAFAGTAKPESAAVAAAPTPAGD